MYPKEYFLERFRNEETEDLLQRYATVDLADEAKEAILELLRARGINSFSLPTLVVAARKASYRQTRGTKECDFCGSSARLSAVLNEGQRFCSKACLRKARLLEVSEDIPAEAIYRHAVAIKNGSCPECRQSGSRTEVRTYHRVWSIGLFTQWTHRTHICCHACGRKTNFGSIMFCVLFGWWSVPWGLVMTPAQIMANITQMLKPMADPEPSEALVQAARLDLAAKLYKQQQQQQQQQSAAAAGA